MTVCFRHGPVSSQVSSTSLHDALPIFTVGELNASGGAGENWGSGHDGAPIELTGAEVILLGDISSRGSEGDGSNLHGTSGNITITGNTVIDPSGKDTIIVDNRSEEHTSELQSRGHLVCRLLLEKNKE